MMFHDAQRTLGQFLAPLTLDEFLDGVLAGGFRRIDIHPADGIFLQRWGWAGRGWVGGGHNYVLGFEI